MVKTVAVIDIGKTNAKVVLIDMVQLAEIEVVTTLNTVLPGPPHPHFDTENLWNFILEALKKFQSQRNIDAITVTTHGASCALLDKSDNLAAPVLDYEHEGPEALADQYNDLRPPFTETGSPRLPAGLNLGAQLFWQFETQPELRQRTKKIVTYPQYWTGRLTGRFTNEVTSLGCHTDLWNPYEKQFSSLVKGQDWTSLFAPVLPANERLGPVREGISELCGLAPTTSVFCGIHDSNASLYPHLVQRTPPFTVISTGTWIICMAIDGKNISVDPERDCLTNVDAYSRAVPSSRFMGGREFEIIMDDRKTAYNDADITNVLNNNIMLLPAVKPSCGPFQGQEARWTIDPRQLTDGQIYVGVSFYLAMMTLICTDLIGADGDLILEGPMAKNDLYAGFLASHFSGKLSKVFGTGTSIGACLLIDPVSQHSGKNGGSVLPMPLPLNDYFERWKSTSNAK